MLNANYKSDVAILVVSCDAYQDVWHPFFCLFFKNWSDCPYPVYLVSNNLHYEDIRVFPLRVGLDIDYSSNLIQALSQIQQDWVIFWVEDRPPITPINTDRLVNLIELAQSRNAGYLKLVTCNPPALVSKEEEIGEITKGSRYCVSMTVALWRKTTLLKILKPGETAWDIEKRGGVQRSKEIEDRFYALPIDSISNPPIQDIHLISKGHLVWRGINALKRENLLHCLEKRPPLSFIQNSYFELYSIVWNVYYYLLWQIKKISTKLKPSNYC
jgi:hypothetical protein